ncbi:hypothetical protein ANAPRD1_01012 [Anaplasma phagocytophilum]|nr:hypothetical protein ANAPRD1_01012 [Anaplasma phagocytophilum]
MLLLCGKKLGKERSWSMRLGLASLSNVTKLANWMLLLLRVYMSLYLKV